jgi:hypothetical protein
MKELILQNIKTSGKNTAVWCENLEEWEQVLKIIGNPQELTKANYNSYRNEYPSINVNDGRYGHRGWYINNSYDVYLASEFIKANTGPQIINSYEIY